LIKEYLLEYTQAFARLYLGNDRCRDFRVQRVRFNYDTEAWEEGTFYLPILADDYVLLTPIDMLTRDDTWISHRDLLEHFDLIPPALPDKELRAQVNNYFERQLSIAAGRARRPPNRQERDAAAMSTVRQYPELLDYYIHQREVAGEEARSVSAAKVADTFEIFVQQIRRVVTDLQARTNFYKQEFSSYDAALARAKGFKHYIEKQDGWKLINRDGEPFAKEAEVQLYFGLIWFGSIFDVNREVNNGRGPVDYKISIGSADKSLIEFKLASNTKLKHNLENQVAIYEKANQTVTSVTVIVCYTASHQEKIEKLLKELGLAGREDIIVIDARSDNKPSASTAK